MMSLIKNKRHLSQSIDFSGVQNVNIHPTDIDAVLEFDNEVLILIELKYNDSVIPTGQRLVLERICDSWHTKKSVVLKAVHYTESEKNIPLELCRVTKFYHNGSWKVPKSNKYIPQVINDIGEQFNSNKCKF